MVGPLSGVRIIEVASIGPGPFCGMVLSDLGADIIRVDRVSAQHETSNVVGRGRRSISVNLKSPAAADVILSLISDAEGLIEGFRPGVAERLGIGPDECLAVNPRLAYGRMTGWGQYGPLANMAGHDINYIALSGALHAMGDPDRPPRPPLNFVGDYGGGAMFLAVGILSAIMHARETGQGQVIDAAMVDGSALLTAMFHGQIATNEWQESRGTNMLDGSAPFYSAYECADGEYLALGAIEPRFTYELLDLLDLNSSEVKSQWYDTRAWPKLKEQVAARIRTKTRTEWEEVFGNSDACGTPLVSLTEAKDHPHNRIRKTFQRVNGINQPSPAPRFSQTPGRIRGANPAPGEHSDDILSEAGYSVDDIQTLRDSGTIGR